MIPWSSTRVPEYPYLWVPSYSYLSRNFFSYLPKPVVLSQRAVITKESSQRCGYTDDDCGRLQEINKPERDLAKDQALSAVLAILARSCNTKISKAGGALGGDWLWEACQTSPADLLVSTELCSPPQPLNPRRGDGITDNPSRRAVARTPKVLTADDSQARGNAGIASDVRSGLVTNPVWQPHSSSEV